MSKKKTLLSAILAIAFCMSLIAGSTFALFTSESKVNIAVQSGKVKLVASLSKPLVYSAEANDNLDPAAEGTLVDENGATYAYTLKVDNTTTTDIDESKYFTNGGEATLSNDGKTVNLDRVTPGDKVELNVVFDNSATNVKVLYRVIVEAKSSVLAQGMQVKIGDGEVKQGVIRYQSAWASLDIGETPASLPIVLALPIDADNTYQDGSVEYTFTVEAVQGNAKVSGVETYETIAATVANYSDFPTVNSTVETTADPETGETVIKNTTLLTESEEANVSVKVTVPATLTFKGENDQDVSIDQNSTMSLQVSNVSLNTDKDTAQETVALDIELRVDGKKVEHATEDVLVTLNVGTGKNITVLKHNGERIDFTYSAQTGLLTFNTKNFSPFEYTYSIVAPVAKVMGANGDVYFYGVDYATDADLWDDVITKIGSSDKKIVVLSDANIPADTKIPADIIIEGGTTGEKPTLTITTTNGDGLKIKNKNVKFKNIIFDGINITSGGYNSLINIEADGVEILGCTFVNGGQSTWNSSILIDSLDNTATVTVTDCIISGSFRGILRESCSANLIINNCDITATYPFNIDGGNGGTVTVNGGALHGWTSYSNVVSVTFNDVEFSTGGYDVVAAYVDTYFNNCTFDKGLEIYAQVTGFNFTLTNCTKNGVQVTAKNFKELFPKDSNVWNKCTTTVDGVQVEKDTVAQN